MSQRFRMFSVVICLLLRIVAGAQDNDPKILDQFGKLNAEETEARLAYAMSQLNSHRGSLLEFVIHRGQDQTFGEPHRIFGIQKTYLLLNKVDKNRILSTFCEPSPTAETQLYLLESPAQRHSCTTDEVKPNETTLFISSLIPNPKYEPGTCCLVDNLGHPGTTEAVAAFADTLQRHVASSAYVVIYGGTNLYLTSDDRDRTMKIRRLDSPAYISELGTSVRQFLRARGIDNSHIVTIVGGYRDDYASIDLWLIPPGGKRPKPTPNYRRRSTRRVSTS